ncbi:MAG: hypothetical protein LBJ95_03015 [Oscillospiraceae bacterium]|jgi:hypothetical protein|nr:hypothetical protein [Oscillospiraceae bacterium]
MKKMKFFCLILSALYIAFTLASCADKSWSLKTSNSSLSPGSFILLEMDAYYAAGQKVSEANPNAKDVLKEKVDDQPANEWIRNKAIDEGKFLLAIKKLFDENGLSLTDEEQKKAENAGIKQWRSRGKTFEDLGVGKDSFLEAKSIIPAKKDKLFEAIYGKDGSNPVNDENLKSYYEDNYTHYTTLSKLLTNPAQDGGQAPQPLTDEEKAAAKAKFDEYVNKLNDGEDIKNIASQFKTDEAMKEEEDPLMSLTEKSDQLTLPEAANNKLKELEIGKAAVVEVEADSTLYLIQKQDVKTKSSEMLEDATERDSVLHEQSKANFDELIKDQVSQMDISVNYAAINQHPPSIFQPKNKKKK